MVIKIKNMKKTKEKLNIKGKITVRGYKKGTLLSVQPLMQRLSRLLSDKSGHSKEIIALRHNIRSILIKGLIDEKITDNLIMVAANVANEVKNRGITGLHIRIRAPGGKGAKTPGAGAQAVVRSLARMGLRIGKIDDVTPTPTDTTKRPGGRRGRRV